MPKKSKSKQTQEIIETLLELAIRAQKNSYSPYSKCKVGAALLTEDGDIFTGTNIENASYGGTVCAERVAIWKALSEKPKSKIKKILVLSPKGKEAWPPCGLCLQVLAEFSQPNTQVYLARHPKAGRSFEVEAYKLKDLLPKSFQLLATEEK